MNSIEAFDIKPTFNRRYEIQDVHDCIYEYGFARIPDFVSSEELKELNLVFELGLTYDNYPYGYGKLARFDVLPTELSSAKRFFEEQFFSRSNYQILEGEFPNYSRAFLYSRF